MRQLDMGEIKLFLYAAYVPLFLIVSEMDVNSRNGEKFEIFSNFLTHPVETPLADLDSSIPECAQVCALHTVKPRIEAPGFYWYNSL